MSDVRVDSEGIALGIEILKPWAPEVSLRDLCRELGIEELQPEILRAVRDKVPTDVMDNLERAADDE